MAFDQLPEVQPDSQKLNLIALWVETWLYGMYTILFFVCVYILYHRRHSAFLFRATVMFALSTAHVVLDFIRAEKSSTRLERAPITVYLINNLIADELVVLRCYIIWGKRKRVMIIPALLVITTAVLSYISETMVILLTSLITNVVVSGLTAGRIWWIGRQARGYLSKEITREYNTAIAIMLGPARLPGLAKPALPKLKLTLQNLSLGPNLIEAEFSRCSVAITPTAGVTEAECR